MAKKLYTINTVNTFMEIIFKPFGAPFAEANPDIEFYNIMDDSLLEDTRAFGSMTPNIASRMLHYAQAAQSSGADGVLVTCTSVNAATKFIKPFLNIPILNIEEPVAEMAVAAGSKIGILATLPTSPAAIGRVIQEKADQIGKEIEIVNAVVDGAYDVLCQGDRDEHDRMVCEELYKLAEKVDVIAFAQISMSMLKHDPVKVPVFKIGTSGLERIKELMNK
jgi:aspartate/glutamate racemase